MRRGQKSTPTGVSLSHPPPSTPYDKTARTGNYLQVFRLPIKKIDVCTIVFLTLCLSFAVAYPKPKIVAQEGGTGAVYFKIPRCRTVPEEELQKRLGRVPDGSGMAAALRLRSASESDLEGDLSDGDMDDIQGDDADAYSDEMIDEEEEEEEEYDDDEESDESYNDKSETYKYMRKRRGVPDGDRPYRGSHVSRRGSNSYRKLHLRLLEPKNNNLTKEENARNRKQNKKELRRKLRMRKSKIPPWNCKVSFSEVEMPPGTFPAKITDGKCVTDKCFFRIYNCEPKKYRIKVLQRDPNSCFPVPHISVNTTYEEKWIFITHRVTVGCNCERRRQKKPRRH